MVDEDYNFSPLKATMAQKIENYFSIFVGVGSKIELGKFFFISRGSTRLATKYGDISHSSSSFLNSLKTRHGNIKERYLHPKKSNTGFFCSNIGWSPPPSIPPHFALLGNFDFVTFLAANQSHCVGLSNFRSSTVAASLERHVNQASSELPVDKAIFSTKSA